MGDLAESLFAERSGIGKTASERDYTGARKGGHKVTGRCALHTLDPVGIQKVEAIEVYNRHWFYTSFLSSPIGSATGSTFLQPSFSERTCQSSGASSKRLELHRLPRIESALSRSSPVANACLSANAPTIYACSTKT